jgi:hypothetical protein
MAVAKMTAVRNLQTVLVISLIFQQDIILLLSNDL